MQYKTVKKDKDKKIKIKDKKFNDQLGILIILLVVVSFINM